MKEFVHLHNHTEYSLLDGLSRIGELSTVAKEFRFPAMAMTDHGNLFGAVSFWESMHEVGVKPILGCEVYVAPASRTSREVVSQKEVAYHLLLLVENETGYRNLCHLVSLGYLEGFYYKPRVDWELLYKYREGLICLSGCLQGELAWKILKNDREGVYRTVKKLKDIFEDRFYLEIQANRLPEQEVVNKQKIALSKELSIPLVATNDNHYIRREDARHHDVLLCVGTQSRLEDPDRLRFPSDEFYVKTPDEMWEYFHFCPSALENTLRIAEKVRFSFTFGEVYLPRFNGVGSPEDLLRELAREGLKERFSEMERKGEILTQKEKEEYKQRLEYELSVIIQKGFAGYFLIVADFIRWARSQKIPVGPGRGSAAGSLVSYALRITDLDPIRFKLIFERFLNPERKSLPDIDVDFCMVRRGEVLDYVGRKYGKDRTAQIGTFSIAKSRQIFKDVGRVLGLSFSETDRITKLMPPSSDTPQLKELYETDPVFRSQIDNDPRIKKTFEIAVRLEGVTRNAGVHAAGVVISDRPLMDLVPLFKSDDGGVVTQYDMVSLEKLGLVKFDFLGLKTLTALRLAVDTIEEIHKKKIVLEEIPLNDPEVYDLLSRGETGGVFQLEKEGMRRLLVKLHPRTFEDLIAVIALYRPGPIYSGMVQDYIDRKNGKKPVQYLLPQLEGILKETYGVVVYQEQVMEIARVLAGYSLGEADNLRKAMGKKVPEIMQEEKARFVEGCVKNKIPYSVAETLFDQISEFAGYAFNKSHSAAYALIAYWTAWMKTHYPLEFMSALLQCDVGKIQELVPLLREVRRMGIQLKPPDVKNGSLSFRPEGGGIRVGLLALKNVGEKVMTDLLHLRDSKGGFTDLKDFLLSAGKVGLNRKVLESLICAGALDSFRYSRKTLYEEMDFLLKWMDRGGDSEGSLKQGDLFSGGEDLPFVLPDHGEWSPDEMARKEREVLGIYLTTHPLVPYQEILSIYGNTTLDPEKLTEFPDRSVVRFGCVVSDLAVKSGGKGRRVIVTVEDLEGVSQVWVQEGIYESAFPFLKEGEKIFIKAELLKDAEGTVRLFAQEIVPLYRVHERYGGRIVVSLPERDLLEDRLKRFRSLLKSHPGTLEVSILLLLEGNEKIRIHLPREYASSYHPGFFQEIQELFPASRVELQWGQ